MELRFRILGFGFWILDFGFWILGFGFWLLDFGFWGSGAPAAGAASMGLQGRFLEAPSLEAWSPGSPLEASWRILEALNGGPLDALEASGGGPHAPEGAWKLLEAPAGSGGPWRPACGGHHKILSIQENGN